MEDEEFKQKVLDRLDIIMELLSQDKKVGFKMVDVEEYKKATDVVETTNTLFAYHTFGKDGEPVGKNKKAWLFHLRDKRQCWIAKSHIESISYPNHTRNGEVKIVFLEDHVWAMPTDEDWKKPESYTR